MDLSNATNVVELNFSAEKNDVEGISFSLFLVQTADANQMGSSSEYVGMLDYVRGERVIKIARFDSADKLYYLIPLWWVKCVDNEVVFLSKTEVQFLNEAVAVTVR